MSLANLKRVRDEVMHGEIGLHLDVTKKLIDAIDEHLAEAKEDVKANIHTVDAELKEKAEQLHVEADHLASKVADLKEPILEHVEEAGNAVGEAAGEALDQR